MYKKVDLFVYSGTGNTYKLAKTFGEISNEKGTSYKINMIGSNSDNKSYEVNNDNLLGLMTPTLGFIQPLSFFRFIFSLPKGKGMNVFLVATGAWTKIGWLFIPGGIGFGLYLAALILLTKGYKVVGIDGAGMPINWTTFFPPYTRKLENRIMNELKSQIYSFSNSILDGKKVYKRKIDLIVGILLFPIPIGFLLIGHQMLAKSTFSNHRCNGCGLCSRICPNNAIKMVGSRNKKPYWTLKCEQCMRCAGYCPQKAIELSFPMLIIYFWFIQSAGIDVYIISLLKIQNKLVDFIIFYIVFLFSIILGYIIFFLINRIKVLNRIFTYLTFTYYWRKYKEPSTDIKELIQISNMESMD